MKPRDKEILIVCRPMLLRTLDVTDKLLPALSGKVITEADELMILSDPRRRYRTKKVSRVISMCVYVYVYVYDDITPHYS